MGSAPPIGHVALHTHTEQYVGLEFSNFTGTPMWHKNLIIQRHQMTPISGDIFTDALMCCGLLGVSRPQFENKCNNFIYITMPR